jgi:ERCC4-related helicase
MIFSQFRESVYEIKDVLSSYEPLIKVMEFVGQSTVAGTRKGVTQKEQMEVVWSKLFLKRYRKLVIVNGLEIDFCQMVDF